MKLDMSAAEFSSLFALFAGAASPEQRRTLEARVQDLRDEQTRLEASNNEAWSEVRKGNQRSYDLERQNSNLTREVETLKARIEQTIEKVRPDAKERQISKMFRVFLDGNKIQAIKAMRELLNLGLREAKLVVEGTPDSGASEAEKTFGSIFKDLGSTNSCVVGEQLHALARYLDKPGGEDLKLVLAGKYHTKDEAPESIDF